MVTAIWFARKHSGTDRPFRAFVGVSILASVDWPESDYKSSSLERKTAY